ncbi:MAG: PEP-CTERM sorting domain-containing protein [Armatimonadota bacterium]
MLTGCGAWRQICLVIVLLLVFGGLSYADWNNLYWEDEFAGGTTDQTWDTFSGGGVGSHTVVDLGGGNYGYQHSAPYLGDPPDVGFAGAYVDAIEGDQGMKGWVDTSPMGVDDSAALSFLRYTPTVVPDQGFGTGYALAITHNSSGQITASIRQVFEDREDLIGSEELVSSTYTDVWFRFLAIGTDGDTRLRGRVWADGTNEPSDWLLDVGVTSDFYNTGSGGVGAVTLTGDLEVATATFDNVAYGTPEPTTMALLVTGVGALILRRRRAA